MQIAWASLTSLEDEFTAYSDNLHAHLEDVSRAETDVQLMGAPKGRGIAGNYRAFKLQDEAALVKDFIRLRHRNDIDGLAIGSSFDSGLREAREILSIPVLGYTETAVLAAHMLADRFAIIAGTDKFHPIFDELLKVYGLEDRVTGIYTPEAEDRYLSLLGNAYESADVRGELAEEVGALAERCVDDGAELIIPGGGALPTLLSYMEGITEFHGVPLMDASAVLVRLTETMADLFAMGAAQTSKQRMYRPPSEEFLTELEDAYDI